MVKKQYGAAETYEGKLSRVMERFGVKEYNFNWDRFGCWIEFRYKGQLIVLSTALRRPSQKGLI
jgi:hypothetical protein